MAAITTAVVAVAATGYSMYSASKQASAQKKAANAQASAQEINAQQVEADALNDIRKVRRDAFKSRGSAIAGAGAGGVDTAFGSVLDVVRESTFQEGRNIAAIQQGADLEAEAYRTGAQAARQSGASAAAAGTAGMVSSAIQGASRVYDIGLNNKWWGNSAPVKTAA